VQIKKFNLYLGTDKPELIITLLKPSLLTYLKPIKMKTKKFLPAIFGTIGSLLFILVSCSSPKMSSVSCPEFPNGRYAKDGSYHNRKKNAALTANHRMDAISHHSGLSRQSQINNFQITKESDAGEAVRVTGTDRIKAISKSEYSEALTASSDNSFIPKLRSSYGINVHPETGTNEQVMYSGSEQQAGCDTIILKSGSRIIGKVEEIGQSEIRYRRCENLTGPVILIAKSGVNRILYVNGTHEVMVSDSPIFVGNPDVKPVYSNAPVKSEPLGIIGFIAGLIGLFIAGLPLGALGVIFGAISLGKIKREPSRFKGKGIAIASIIIGIIAAVGAIIIMAGL
jgi:hypothetical protein